MLPQNKLLVIDSRKEKLPKVSFPPHFHESEQMRGRATSVRAGDGWLIGFDAGEFGGGLWWSDASGRHTKALGAGNVRTMVPRGQEVLVLAGSPSVDTGVIYSYKPANDSPGDLVRIADLGSTPGDAALQSDGTLLIATNHAVLKLGSDDRLQTLWSASMGMLYPQSIVADDKGTIFVGMRFYVVRLQPGSKDGPYAPSWFVRSKCTETKTTSYDCVCKGPTHK